LTPGAGTTQGGIPMPSAARPLNPSEKLDWLRLIRSENVGPVGLM